MIPNQEHHKHFINKVIIIFNFLQFRECRQKSVVLPVELCLNVQWCGTTIEKWAGVWYYYREVDGCYYYREVGGGVFCQGVLPLFDILYLI